jgi:hypothetical protein
VVIGETRHVFDITHTINNESIVAEKYFDYLNTHNRNIASNIESFIEYETGEDVNIKHGFPRK